MCNPDPPNYFASKYSLPHVAACLAVRGSAGYESVDDSALDDPAIAALHHRVHITEDPAMSSAVPALKPARVTPATVVVVADALPMRLTADTGSQPDRQLSNSLRPPPRRARAGARSQSRQEV